MVPVGKQSAHGLETANGPAYRATVTITVNY